MRYLTILIGSLLMMQVTVAQNINDVNRFLTTELNGSARYTSMAGAFGSLGGDLTALSFNPASSSVFLNSEFGASINYKNKLTEGTYYGTSANRENDDLSLDHFGAVFVFNNKNTEGPWSRVSVGINLHKIATYDQKAFVNGTNTNGIDQYFEYYADGLDFENLPIYDGETVSEVYKILGAENGFGAQQAFLGYQSYIVNPFNFENGNTKELKPLLEDSVFNSFSDVIEKRKQNGEQVEFSFIGIESAEIIYKDLNSSPMEVTVRFISEMITCIKNNKDELFKIESVRPGPAGHFIHGTNQNGQFGSLKHELSTRISLGVLNMESGVLDLTNLTKEAPHHK